MMSKITLQNTLLLKGQCCTLPFVRHNVKQKGVEERPFPRQPQVAKAYEKDRHYNRHSGYPEVNRGNTVNHSLFPLLMSSAPHSWFD